jgi:uncharacterized membrane protein YdjX (TVP38/TMEM64 family)
LNRLRPILKLILLLVIILGPLAYVYFVSPHLFDQFKTMEGVNAFLEQYKAASILVYIGLQIAQIVISVIPGQFIQFAAGYAYGFWFGYLFSIIGIALGTTCAFYLARVLGRDGVHLLFGEEKITRFVKQLNSKRGFAIMFALFLIPGFPKDLISYAAGVSEFRYRTFLILSLAGRTPALMGTIMMGSMLHKESYIGMIILGVVATGLFVYLLIRRHWFTSYIDKIYVKLSAPPHTKK